ncbi:MAG: hypothetical protein VB071_09735, partial [Lawsonibacter sp.]|nr:hypothetical protein [Lawsonibacter sp.]
MNAIKRCLALALTLVMVLSLIPAQAIADRLSKSTETSNTSLLSTALHTSLSDTAQALSLVPVVASIQSPSGIADDTRVSYEILATGMISTADTRSAVLRFTLGHPVEQPVTFHYTAISGSADTVQHLTGTCSGTVSFAAGEMQQDVEIEIASFADNPNNYGTANSPNAFWTGTRLFYLYCDSINNALFTGDRNSITIPIPVESEFNYAATYNNAVSAVLVDLNNVPDADSPGVYLVPTDGALTLTAEISGDVREMLDAGVFTRIQMPTGYFLNETDAAGIVSYQVSRSRQTDGFGSNTTLTYDLSVGSGEKTSFFSDVYPQTAAVSQVGLGKNAESNGIFKRLDFIFDGSNLTAPVKACFLNESGGYLQQQVRFTDDTAPSVNSVTIGMYEAHYGDEIPVIISFSEPIHTDGITFTVDGKTLYPMEATGTISDSVSFLYTVGDAFLDATEVSVNVENIIGAVDLSGKEQESTGSGSASALLSSFDPERAFFYCAEPTVTLNQGTSRCAAATVSIPIKRDGHLSNWLLDLSRLDDSDISSAVKAKVMTAAGIIDIPLTVQTDAVSVTGLMGSFTAPENTTGENQYYAPEIYMDTGSGYKLVYGLSAFYAVPPLTLVDDTSDLTINYSNWPSGNSMFADAGTNLSLHYTINVAATWQGTDYFTWTSSDEAIAAIDVSGNITLTGMPGEVSFTLMVTNPLSADAMTFVSRTLTVREAEGAYLYVPNGLKNQEILMGGTAKISIFSNLCQRNDTYGGSGTKTDFTFTLYAADYEGDVLKKGDLLSEETLSATAEAPTTFYTVPAQLQNITVKGRYGYILEVSAKDMQSSVTLTDTANIRVRALPARAVLTRMESASLTDSTDTFPVGFDIDNKNAETAYLLTVTKNSQSVPVLTTSSPAEIGRTLTVSIGSVDDSHLMDVYTVSLKAKNGPDEAWSYDSYCVYIYNADAMKILVDSFPYGGTTLMLKANFEDGDIIYNTDVLRSP